MTVDLERDAGEALDGDLTGGGGVVAVGIGGHGGGGNGGGTFLQGGDKTIIRPRGRLHIALVHELALASLRVYPQQHGVEGTFLGHGGGHMVSARSSSILQI